MRVYNYFCTFPLVPGLCWVPSILVCPGLTPPTEQRRIPTEHHRWGTRERGSRRGGGKGAKGRHGGGTDTHADAHASNPPNPTREDTPATDCPRRTRFYCLPFLLANPPQTDPIRPHDAKEVSPFSLGETPSGVPRRARYFATCRYITGGRYPGRRAPGDRSSPTWTLDPDVGCWALGCCTAPSSRGILLAGGFGKTVVGRTRQGRLSTVMAIGWHVSGVVDSLGGDRGGKGVLPVSIDDAHDAANEIGMPRGGEGGRGEYFRFG